MTIPDVHHRARPVGPEPGAPAAVTSTTEGTARDPARPAPAIATRGLSKRYRRTTALDALDLEVPSGAVFGYLGPNGAGKSTTIRLLLGLIRPTSGSATVLGHDVAREREAVHRDIGYLPGDFVAYGDMTGAAYLDLIANLRGGVAREDVDRLVDRFQLDTTRRIDALSHGNRQKVGIIQAFMHRPSLLVLDEPTGGLDPLMQREFLELVRETRDEGRTVFLSSHVLGEVEAVADLIGIIRAGRLVVVADVEELKSRTRRRLALSFREPGTRAAAALDGLDNVHDVVVDGHAVELTVEGSMADLFAAAAPFGIDRVVSNEVDLEGVFLQYYEQQGA